MRWVLRFEKLLGELRSSPTTGGVDSFFKEERDYMRWIQSLNHILWRNLPLQHQTPVVQEIPLIHNDDLIIKTNQNYLFF